MLTLRSVWLTIRRFMHKVFTVFLALIPLLASAASAAEIPEEKELRTLARESLLAFNQASQAKDFTTFHKQIAKVWQEQITPAKLQAAFQEFSEQNIDLAPMLKVDPVLQKPTLDSDGVLLVQGYYAAAPHKVTFRLKYIEERGAWKLIGIKANVTPVGATDAKPPSEAEAKKLATESLIAFNDAIRAKDFASFHKQIAAVWQKQVTPEQLQKLFQEFIESEIDISPIAKMEPTFDAPPAVDEDGVLNLDGYYATKPSQVRFTLGYLLQGAEWRLVQINVRVKGDGEKSSGTAEASEDEEEEEDDSTPTPAPRKKKK